MRDFLGFVGHAPRKLNSGAQSGLYPTKNLEAARNDKKNGIVFKKHFFRAPQTKSYFRVGFEDVGSGKDFC